MIIITQGAHFMSRAMFSAKDALLPPSSTSSSTSSVQESYQMHDSQCELIICTNLSMSVDIAFSLDGWTDGQTDGEIDRQTDMSMDRRMDGRSLHVYYIEARIDG